MTGKSEGAVRRVSSQLRARRETGAPRALLRSQDRCLRLLVIAGCIVGAGGCTTVNTATIKEHREAGISRNYDRPPSEVFPAAVRALESLRSDPNWRTLEITENDPAQGTVIAERDLDSAVIPGLGERDAIGIFVADVAGGDSKVTVVRMSSDQLPGAAGTTVNTARDASGLLFPAIDAALATIPEGPRTALAPAPVAPAPVATDGARAAAETTLDRLYAFLRDGGTWRPLTREIANDGGEQIRVGAWASLTATGERVTLRVKAKSSAVDAARLALDLEHAGFDVEVVDARGR